MVRNGRHWQHNVDLCINTSSLLNNILTEISDNTMICGYTWGKFRDISRDLVRSKEPLKSSNRFEHLHRARQYYCRALCKISNWRDNWAISYGQTRFCKIYVRDAFRTHILYCSSPRAPSPYKDRLPRYGDFQVKDKTVARPSYL